MVWEDFDSLDSVLLPQLPEDCSGIKGSTLELGVKPRGRCGEVRNNGTYFCDLNSAVLYIDNAIESNRFISLEKLTT
jgi:hypothetical protein